MGDDPDGEAIRRRRQRLIAVALSGLMSPLTGCDEIAPRPCLEPPAIPAPGPAVCLSEMVIEGDQEREPVVGPALPIEAPEPRDAPTDGTDEAEGSEEPTPEPDDEAPREPPEARPRPCLGPPPPGPRPCLSPPRRDDDPLEGL